MNTRSGLIMGLLLCLPALPAQARSHLDRDELKILSAASVAVVYVDTDTALESDLDPDHHMLGVTPLTAVLADVLNNYRLHMLLAHIGPYHDALQGLALPASTHMGVQQALASVSWLGKMPWADVRQDPKDTFFLTRQAELAKAAVVIFIRPRLFLDPSIDALYLVCSIDIETAGARGREVTHYDSSQVIASEPVLDADLPVVAGKPDPTQDAADLRMARLLADGGAGFKKLYARLMLQSEQQLYYYFTGSKAAPPVPAVRVGQ